MYGVALILKERDRMYTAEDVALYIKEEEEVKFIRLTFCDFAGQQKSLTVMADELPKAMAGGISADASAIEGFGEKADGNLYLIPDPSTLAAVPWHSMHGKMIRMYCSLRTPEGKTFQRDSRYLLQKAVDYAKVRGVLCSFQTEYEFYLFQTDENAERTQIPYDKAGYMDMDPGDKCESIRREICITLSGMGIRPKTARHEAGPGQNRIDFCGADPMSAADNATTFKSVVRTVAARSGLYASFYPKPLPEQKGNGLHIGLSVCCSDGQDRSASFLAGIFKHICEITSILNPTQESYRRLSEYRAPKYIEWSTSDCGWFAGASHAQSEGVPYITLHSPDPGANPYLAFSLILYAGMDGIERGLVPPAPDSGSLSDKQFYAALTDLPTSLTEAKEQAMQSTWLHEVLPELFN